MPNKIDLAGEFALLRWEFDALISSAGDDISARSLTLSDWLRVEGASDGQRRLAPISELTVLYPLLQVQCGRPFDLAAARQATLAHACLVVHALIEDRHKDRWMVLDAGERGFSDYILQRGLDILSELNSGCIRHDKNSPFRTELFGVAEFNRSNESALRCIAPQKAAYRFLATHTLLRSMACTPHELAAAAKAFDYVAIALQYADDAENWREDLALRDDNLLLARLVDLGLHPYRLPDNEHRVPNVGHALLRQDVLNHVEVEVNRHLDEAIRLQKQLGCECLTDLLQELKTEISDTLPRITAAISSEVIVACLLVQTA